MKKRLMILLGALCLGGCATAVKNPPQTVANVNLQQYAGTWYEIASFPNRFQRDCRCTTANYQLTSDQEIIVTNSCLKASTGKRDTAVGKAWSVSKSNSKLKVQFFWPFSGDYWILHITPGYQAVLVGNPQRNYLWILARKPTLSTKRYQELVSIAKQQGFAVDNLRKTNQGSCQYLS